MFDASTTLSQALINLKPKKSIYLIDPYLFPTNHDDDYIDFFLSIFGETLSEISFLKIFTKTNHNKKIKSQLLDRILNDFEITFELVETNVFHDRFWIVDNEKGLFIGTSLNGIGKKYSIFDTLKKQDIADIISRCNSL